MLALIVVQNVRGQNRKKKYFLDQTQDVYAGGVFKYFIVVPHTKPQKSFDCKHDTISKGSYTHDYSPLVSENEVFSAGGWISPVLWYHRIGSYFSTGPGTNCCSVANSQASTAWNTLACTEHLENMWYRVRKAGRYSVGQAHKRYTYRINNNVFVSADISVTSIRKLHFLIAQNNSVGSKYLKNSSSCFENNFTSRWYTP